MTLTDAHLTLLRGTGDDLVDGWLQRVKRAKAAEWLGELNEGRRLSRARCDELGIHTEEWYWESELSFDPEKLEAAASLFRNGRGTVISGALLFSGLPSTYAAVEGVQILGETRRLQSSASRRILEVAQFLTDVTTGPFGGRDMLSPGHPGFEAARSLRIYHGLIRCCDPEARHRVPGELPEDPVWINQQELLGTLLTFTVGVFEVLERLDRSWTLDELEAYVYLWDCVGELLGVGSRDACPDIAEHTRLRPLSVADSVDLLERIRQRQWPSLDDELLDTSAVASACGLDIDELSAGEQYRRLARIHTGRVLFRALLTEIDRAVGDSRDRGRATEVFRYLLDPRAAQILGLGTPNAVDAAAERLLRRKVRTGPFTSYQPVNPLQAARMRSKVDRMTTRAFIHFVRSASPERPFRLHGLEDLILDDEMDA